MNIGELRNVNGRLMGSIATRTIDLPRIGLRPVENDNPRAPKYEVVALNVARRWVQIGAVWEAVMKRTGEVFLAGTIDDPSLPEALPVALFPATDFDGYMVAWRRDTMRSDIGGGFGASNYDREQGERSRGGNTRDQQDSGFGESTAGVGGELVGADGPGDLDDDMPF
ncbi:MULTISPECIES: DUF736 domain-containing protein [unclassified Sphingomonas]|uniref:DUF736 domain-containing protein n=1 Tax=unclassified Sphingomonas TaxID=196159 RepID=UPI0028565574|nr:MULTISPECIES: DUF736 domain-containing protein [unclassified Sphingomonas]MDR6116541.1 uncharacterized protein (DUF736 family) [Sphingomonas sp. SORGH_AS_0789]MDR6149782.1 uncharacterized protein (DUF736 family) [Sphingomonas sp. SORGH_AS_0742]